MQNMPEFRGRKPSNLHSWVEAEGSPKQTINLYNITRHRVPKESDLQSPL